MPLELGQTAQAPLDLFGGMDTEISPADCPNGISPLNADLEYAPGSVTSRAALRRLYSARPNTTVTSLGQFRQPNGDMVNLVMYSDGTLWAEDVASSPGVLGQIATLTAGSRFRMVNAFNRAYLAITDGLVGTDAPRQYDGVNFDRLSQNGPGAPPACADSSATGTISSITGTTVGIAASTGIAATTDPGAATATLTITTSTAHGLSTGQAIVIAGVTPTEFNGDYIVTSTPSTTTFTCTLTFVQHVVNGCARSGTTTELDFAYNPGIQVGDVILVSGMPDTTFNGLFTITSIPGTGRLVFISSGDAINSGAGGGTVVVQTLAAAGGGQVVSGATITLAAAPSNVNVGDPIQISGSAAGDATHPYDTDKNGNPSRWTILTVNGATLTISVEGVQGLNGSNASTTGGTWFVGGLSSAGQYQAVVLFQTRNGYLTKPSPPVTFTSLGGRKFSVSNIPVGPSNVVARIIAFTAAGGSDFFYIPASVSIPATIPGSSPIVIGATVVPDNTTSSAVFSFSDNALLAATGIGVPGNDLFNQVTLGPCVGVSAYASRLAAWGDPNALQNLLNMGFDGGYASANVPSGWTVETSGGTLVSSGVDFGFAWQITGDGTSNELGRISQGAALDWNYVPVLLGSTAYTWQAWIASSGIAGDVKAEIYSATDGVLATATIALAGASAAGKFYTANFSAVTPAKIPADAKLRYYAVNQASGDTVTIDETNLFPTAQPQNPLLRLSYVENPEAFDGVTGLIGSTQDPTQVQAMTELRGVCQIHTQLGLLTTSDSPSQEPSGWEVTQLSDTVGALSPWAVDAGRFGQGSAGEQWGLIASRDGLYIFWGAQPVKISQEIQTTWESISWDYADKVWVLNDLANRRAYIGLPTAGAKACNTLLTMDYRELNSAQQIAESPPIHISFTGKMIASDLTRKWSPWTLTMNCAAMLALDLNISVACFGGGNGQPFGASGFGNAYRLGPYFATDDDYGQINPFYWTYGFVSREEEQQLGVGGFLKLFPYATAFATGVGTLTLTPATDALANAWPSTAAWPLPASGTADLQFGLNVRGERCFFKIASQPLAGQTDNGFSLQKLIVGMRPDPMATNPMAS